MLRIQRPAACDDGNPRRLPVEPEPPAERPILLGRGRKDGLRPPAPRWRGADGTPADHDDIRRGAQQAHHEPVGRVAAADQLVRARERRDRDDAVDRGDEVREQARLRQDEVAAVEPAQLAGQLERAGLVALEEERERLEPRRRGDLARTVGVCFRERRKTPYCRA
jgi:hypothetical protein